MTPAPEVTRPSAWLAFRQSVVHFDTAKMNPWIGLRNAIGVALPLFAGVTLHSPAAGVGAALGALNVAFRDSDAPYLQRSRHMLLASVLMGIAVFAGSVSGRDPVVAVLVVTFLMALSASWTLERTLAGFPTRLPPGGRSPPASRASGTQAG